MIIRDMNDHHMVGMVTEVIIIVTNTTIRELPYPLIIAFRLLEMTICERHILLITPIWQGNMTNTTNHLIAIIKRIQDPLILGVFLGKYLATNEDKNKTRLQRGAAREKKKTINDKGIFNLSQVTFSNAEKLF